ncbi:S-adenosyl-L-methionine-dependent methyltransferase [Podospora aff. communis PSN243]|uniref:S-adenosyl-L-methionine-dependent methyltransferase n=1 Tax=Podospora aff. communis PSN243 TaxID=3040156 RepID=A0AAV9G5T1_9PEZI|nr:S-adenosyl-L-methionine-dependent methyltransferase [Podospora aff. communis PSN243]
MLNQEKCPSGFEFTFEAILDARTAHRQSPTDDEDSESLTSNVREFPERFGRTYHAYKDGAYVFPNDSNEQARMEYLGQKIIGEILDGRLHLAPFSRGRPPKRVLDVATGTGDWATQMGDRYPTAYVEGIDLSPIQPLIVPPNVQFFVQDASEQWNYKQPFDFIHTRLTLGSFADFKKEVIQQAFDTLEPGGWLESLDANGVCQSDDGTLTPDSALGRWTRDLNAASEIIGKPLCVAHKLRGWFEEVGFVDIHEHGYKLPINGWPDDPFWSEIGRMSEQNLLHGLDGFSLGLFCKAFERTPEQVRVALVDVRRDIQDTSIHGYQLLYVVWGRKPG